METFIVRVWTPSPDLADQVPPGELHGSVEHVGSKENDRFSTAGHLLEILRNALERRAESPDEASASNALDLP